MVGTDTVIYIAIFVSSLGSIGLAQWDNVNPISSLSEKFGRRE
jgi:hypothetical protein